MNLATGDAAEESRGGMGGRSEGVARPRTPEFRGDGTGRPTGHPRPRVAERPREAAGGKSAIHLEPYSYFGSVLRIESRGEMLLTETGYESSLTLPVHSHGSAHLAVLVEGCYLERLSDAAYLCLPGDAVRYSADVLHENRFGRRPSRCLNFEFPLEQDPESCQTSRSLVPRELEVLIESRGRRSRISAPLWVRAVRESIEGDPSASLSGLAEMAGVHPSLLARRFRSAYGLSVGRYAALCRIRSASKRLIETDSPLAEIAYDLRYFDQSHLTNAFARATGFTPAALRDLARR